jgi:hypothetical protein
MVVMLRSLGIPARIVTGFYGGEANSYGDYVALRKADAHSWVEAYFPGIGFATFDPTPAAALDMRLNRSWLKGVTEALDALKLSWYRWVVEYNLDKQTEFLASLLGWSRGREGAFSGPGIGWGDIKEIRKRLKALPWAWIGLSALAVLAGVPAVAWVVRRRRRRGRVSLASSREPAVRAYRRVKRALRGRGLARGVSETQLEFARRVAATHPAVAGPMHELTWAYLRVALAGERTSDPDRMRALADAVRAGLR